LLLDVRVINLLWADETGLRCRRGVIDGRNARQAVQSHKGLQPTSEIGTPLEPSNIDRRSFKPLLKKAGPPDIRFHDLRHTCATVLLSQGVNPKLVQELLGHADIKLTLGTYSHFPPSTGDQAANAMESALG
jgi:integrase